MSPTQARTTIEQRIIKYGLVAIVAIMPFHAFLVIWLGHLFGHEAVFQSWKEVVVLVMALAATVYAVRGRLLAEWLGRSCNLAALAYLAVSVVVSLIVGHPGSRIWWFGVKTDLVMVALFLAVQLAASLGLRRWLLRILVGTSVIVALIAVLQIWLIPAGVLTHLGYSSSTIEPIQRIDPELPNLRAFATLGGPNQLGTFLILPWCYVAAAFMKQRRLWHPIAFALLSLGLVLTYSRSAWLGALAGLGLTIALGLPRRRAVIFIFSSLAGLAVVIALAVGHLSGSLQYYVLHQGLRPTGYVGSTDLHLRSTLQALKIAEQHPWGLGLGAAGPASFQSSHPIISENYYLQLAIETGLLGLVAFLAWQAFCLRRLIQLRAITSARALAGGLVGIGVVNFFLHGWADSSTALVFWGLAGVIVAAEGAGNVQAKSVS